MGIWTKRGKRANVAILLSLAMVAVLLCSVGCSGSDGTPEPKDIVPTSVPGFTLVDQGQQVTLGDGDWVHDSATNYYEPLPDSVYWGEVRELKISVKRYKDDSVAGEVLDYISVEGIRTEIQVGGELAVMNYLSDYLGCAGIVRQQQGGLIIQSTSYSEWEVEDADESVLKEAAIQGLMAVTL